MTKPSTLLSTQWEGDLCARHGAVLSPGVAATSWPSTNAPAGAGSKQAYHGAGDEAPGGKRYAVGDNVVTLAPSCDGRFVTSERGTVTAVAPDRLTVRFDDGRTALLAGEELGSDRLDHADAVTVHRMQGGTVDRSHVVADGGGRELTYVAMSRARDTSHVHVVAVTPTRPSKPSQSNGPPTAASGGCSMSTSRRRTTWRDDRVLRDTAKERFASLGCAPNLPPSRR